MTTQQIKELSQYEKDMGWIFKNYEDLKQHYAEQYVAVYKQEVIDHDTDMKILMTRLRKKYEKKAGSLAIEFITAKKDELIL